MADELSGGAAGAPIARSPAPRPLFSVRLSIASALIIASLTIPGILMEPADSPLELLARPEDSLDRLVSRQMDLWEAARRAPLWQRALAALFVSGDPAAQAADWYEEVAVAFDSPRALLYRGVLLREAGAADDAGRHEEGDDPSFDPLPAPARAWLRGAYPAPGDPPLDRETGDEVIRELRDLLPSGWIADTLVARVAQRSGDAAARDEAQAAMSERGHALLGRAVALGGISILIALAGVGILVIGRGQVPRLAAAPLPPPWSGQDGLGLFLAGGAAFLLVANGGGLLIPAGTPAGPIAAMLAGVPMVVLTARCLAARSTSLGPAFGLRIDPGKAPALLAVTVVLVALTAAAAPLIALVGEVLGLTGHWADGFPEEMLWAPAGVVALHVADTVAWTPFVEELAFRGVLYGTLRRRLPVWPAAVLSVAIFALAHGYGALGLASVFASGLLWTLAYERTRSLLPAILAHGVNNLVVAGDMLALLRL